MLDIAYFGNDFGTQRGLFISPAMWQQFMRAPLKRFFDVSHEFGCKVMKHSCGAVRDIIPCFIEDGVDVSIAVQVAAAGMDLPSLVRDFGNAICLHGAVDTQRTLPFGSTAERPRGGSILYQSYAGQRRLHPVRESRFHRGYSSGQHSRDLRRERQAVLTTDLSTPLSCRSTRVSLACRRDRSPDVYQHLIRESVQWQIAESQERFLLTGRSSAATLRESLDLLPCIEEDCTARKCLDGGKNECLRIRLAVEVFVKRRISASQNRHPAFEQL